MDKKGAVTCTVAHRNFNGNCHDEVFPVSLCELCWVQVWWTLIHTFAFVNSKPLLSTMTSVWAEICKLATMQNWWRSTLHIQFCITLLQYYPIMIGKQLFRTGSFASWKNSLFYHHYSCIIIVLSHPIPLSFICEISQSNGKWGKKKHLQYLLINNQSVVHVRSVYHLCKW